MIDVHCHIDLYSDPLSVAQECHKRSVSVVAVTTTPSAFNGTYNRLQHFNNIKIALGLHPQLAKERKSELFIFKKLLETVLFVGEIGLDGSPECISFIEEQKAVFESILKSCSLAGGRILSIHSRLATMAVLDELKKFSNAGIPIMHWFSGNDIELKETINLGCWFSVGPPMLTSKKGRLIVSRIPRDRLLTETDGPFTQVNKRMLMPWDTQMAVSEISSIWGIPISYVKETIRNNYNSLIREAK